MSRSGHTTCCLTSPLEGAHRSLCHAEATRRNLNSHRTNACSRTMSNRSAMEGSKLVAGSCSSTSSAPTCRSASAATDKDSIIRYSRAVRRLHDRRLQQATTVRRSAVDRRASWHVESSHASLWPAVSPCSADDVDVLGGGTDSDADSAESRPGPKYASTQCLATYAPRCHDGAHQGRRSSTSSWTPLGRKERFASFWSLNSVGSGSEVGLQASASTSDLKDNESSGSGQDSSVFSHADVTDTATSPGVTLRTRRKNFAKSNLMQSHQSLDFERRHNVTKAITWVKEQMREIHESNQKLAHEMSTMLGSVQSLRTEFEEGGDEENFLFAFDGEEDASLSSWSS